MPSHPESATDVLQILIGMQYCAKVYPTFTPQDIHRVFKVVFRSPGFLKVFQPFFFAYGLA